MEYFPIYLFVFLSCASFFCAMALRMLGRENPVAAGKKSFLDLEIEKLSLELERSGANVTISQYLLMSLVCPVAFCIVVFLACPAMPYLLIPAIAGGAFFPRIVVRYLKSREDEAYSERFAAALNQMSASLNAGLSFGQAVDDVILSDLVHKQVRDDFRRLSASIKMGIPITGAFYEYAKRTGNEDVYDVAVAVSIMLETGKDEGAGIKQIQKNIEDRMMYRKKRKASMAESRALVYASDIIPVIVLLVMIFGTPDIIGAYFESSAMTVLFVFMIGWIMAGSVVVHRMLLPKKIRTSSALASKGKGGTS